MSEEFNPVKRKILDTAFYAFSQAGYKAVSMDQVSRSLRISKKTIYKHFGSKEEILETALEELFAEVESMVRRLDNGRTPQETLEAFFVAYRHFVISLEKSLRKEINTYLPHLSDRIQAFEKQVLHRSFNTWLKKLRSKKLVHYPSPTREITAAMFRMMKCLAENPEDKVVYLLHSLMEGMVSATPKPVKASKKKKKKT